MNVEEFRKYGKEVIDYICQYGSNIEERDVAPTLNPGYLKKLLPGMKKIYRNAVTYISTTTKNILYEWNLKMPLKIFIQK